MCPLYHVWNQLPDSFFQPSVIFSIHIFTQLSARFFSISLSHLRSRFSTNPFHHRLLVPRNAFTEYWTVFGSLMIIGLLYPSSVTTLLFEYCFYGDTRGSRSVRGSVTVCQNGPIYCKNLSQQSL